jgi:HAD superfamily hydrolase (TIGR01490 family)
MGGEGKNPEVALRPAVFFDLDGTWFRWQLFDEWIRRMISEGIFPELVYELARQERQAYQNREGSFSEWVSKQVEAYSSRMNGVRVEDAKFVANLVIAEKGKRVHVFTRELAKAALLTRYRRIIISGSPLAVVEAFAEANGIGTFLGTEHEERGGVYTGETIKEWVNDKAEAVRHQAETYGIDLENSAAIGDGYGDRRMLELVGFPICFNPEKRLRDLALERGWLIVVEKKDCLHTYRRHAGETKFVRLDEYLPASLARELEARLAAMA